MTISETTINLQLGNCIELLKKIPSGSIDQIFADPPYNLSGATFQTVQSGKMVTCDKGEWDIIEDIDKFNELWIKECIRVLSDNGTIWISGTLHNHPSVGVILKKLNLWVINDVIWFKRNAAPLLSKNRLAPSTELIWVASKSKKYYFDYEMAKMINGGKQMRNLWEINAERHKTSHPTEKPETLLERILLLGSQEGDIILDPFTGSGTTGVVAKRLKRNFIGFEISPEYFEIAKNRIDSIKDCNKAIYSEKLLQQNTQLEIFLKQKYF
ncbi:DNA-methyltransferase [Capnocytophaga canis]|uniref:Methyltransferase n=1 Tax=Capnocytophaga canis TaxID=1848903 RepID=A0A3A1YFG6_9FLAO|nr:site-specific DNA-methyltransferase [Capnocytophaga canis]RIY36892.1 site-specific DNA-methyltransferase [Capnocytophaga canis]